MPDPFQHLLSSPLGAKPKVKALAAALADGSITAPACAAALSNLGDADRATVIEGLESVTRARPELVDDAVFVTLIGCLSDPAPRVRWESARTIANTAAGHPTRLDAAVGPLLANASHEGTVVRWATAHALTALVQAGHGGENLVTRLRDIAESEADTGVRKVYAKALRKRR